MEHGAYGAPAQALSHRPSQNAPRLRQRAAARGAELFHGCSAAWADMPMNTYACAVRRVRPPPTMPAAPPAGGVEHDDSRRGEPLDGTQTSPVVLADLEHVLRLPGHPVRIRPAERQCQPHLPDAGR